MTRRPIRRVVIVVDSDERTAILVREAARVAARLGAELEGLFLEDEALVALAGHRFASRISSGAERRSLTPEDLELEWRSQSRYVAETLEREAAREAVPARFEVRRAAARTTVRERLDAGDVVLVGWGGWAPSAAHRAPVRVLYDGSEASEHALDLATELVGDDGVLAIWALVDSEEALAPIESGLRARLSALAGRLRVAPIHDPSAATLRHVVAASPGGLLLVPRSTAVARQLADRSAAARFPSSVFLVGAGAEPPAAG